MTSPSVQATSICLNGRSEQKYLLRSQIAPFLRAIGYSYCKKQIDKLCAPAVGQGPPVALQLGARPLYSPDAVVAWAKERLRRRIDHAFGQRAT